MRNEELLDLANDPDLVAGIYNYCDRWCERCSFTSRCLVYKTEKADEITDPACNDITNAAFWNRLHDIFEQTRQMITAWAEENGVDLSAASLAEVDDQRRQRRRKVKKHSLAVISEQYAFAVREWFDREFAEQNMSSNSAIGAEGLEHVEEYFDVIHWYQFQIAVKIMRGLSSRLTEQEESYEGNQRDSDGSIKVALIGIRRSMTAWKFVAEVFPAKVDSIYEFMGQLEKLRAGVEREFPLANDFIRPGLDENLVDTLQ